MHAVWRKQRESPFLAPVNSSKVKEKHNASCACSPLTVCFWKHNCGHPVSKIIVSKGALWRAATKSRSSLQSTNSNKMCSQYDVRKESALKWGSFWGSHASPQPYLIILIQMLIFIQIALFIKFSSTDKRAFILESFISDARMSVDQYQFVHSFFLMTESIQVWIHL